MQLLNTLSRVMQQQGDKLSVAIETQEGGDTPMLRLVITPRLAPVRANATAQEVAYRSAMRQPLIVTGTAEECEAQLERHIGNYQRHIDDTAESLQRMAESRNKAERTTAANPANESTATKAQESPEPEATQETPLEESQPGGIGSF